MEDLISRQAAIDALEREKTFCTAYRDGYSPTDPFARYNMGLADGIKALKAVPSAQKHGKWYTHDKGARYFGEQVVCSECGETFWGWMKKFHYCPNCGARMEA